MKRIALLSILLISACTSESGTPYGSAGTGYNPTPEEASRRVRIVEGTPTVSGRTMRLSASICRGAPVGGPPTRENALLLLKTRTLSNGFLALHSVSVGPVGEPLKKECPGGVRAQGVGFTPG